MRVYLTKTGKILPFFNRHKRVWRVACEHRKKIREAQARHKRYCEKWKEKRDYDNEQMKKGKCKLSEKETCMLGECVHYQESSLLHWDAKGHQFFSRKTTYHGQINYRPPMCKLWGKDNKKETKEFYT